MEFRHLYGLELFDPEFYRKEYNISSGTDADLYSSYLSSGKKAKHYPNVAAKDCFDEKFYLQNYPEIAKCGLDAKLHYINFGKREGRFANSILKNGFDEVFYLRAYPEAARSPLSPIAYYLQIGQKKNHAINTWHGFVLIVYNLFLNRNPTKSEITIYQSPNDIIDSVINSEERKKLILADPTFKPVCESEITINLLGATFFNKQFQIEKLNLIAAEYCIQNYTIDKGINFFNKNYPDNFYYMLRILKFMEFNNPLLFECIYTKTVIKFLMEGKFKNEIEKFFPASLYYYNLYKWYPDYGYWKNILDHTKKFFHSPMVIADGIEELINFNLYKYNNKEIIDLVQAILLVRHIPPYIAHKIIEITRSILNLTYDNEKIAINRYSDIQLFGKQKLLFVNGFGWSGCTPVYNCLLDSPHVSSLTPSLFPDNTEKEPRFTGYIHKFLTSNFHADPNIFSREFLLFFLEKLLAFNGVYSRRSVVERLIHTIHTAYTKDITLYNKYIDEIAAFTNNIIYSYCNNNFIFFRDSAKFFLFNLCAIFNSPISKKYCMVNNGFFSTKYIESFPSGTILIFAHRDPRDQAISCCNMNNYKIEQFIANQKIKFEELKNTYKQYKNMYRFIPVRMEKLATEQTYRKKLFVKLGLEYFDKSQFFNPDYTKTRIGRYKTYLSPAEIKKIENSMPEMISGDCDKMFDEYFE